MRKLTFIVAAAALVGPGAITTALAGQAHTSFFSYSTASQSYADKECEAEKQVKDEEVEPVETAKDQPTGPEPLYFGF